MTTSVIICAYTLDRWAALQAAVVSCHEQSSAPDEVILVIDYNPELEERSRREFPNIRVVANRLSKGLSGARNTGVLVSTSDIVVFLDDDAFGEATWLETLTNPFVDPSVAGTGGWIVPLWEASEPKWFPRTFYWVLGCSYDGLAQSGATIRNPIGASMAMRRSVFSEVGGFTDGIGRIGRVPLGCEETELCIRYSQRHPDQRFVLVRESLVQHRVPSSRCTWAYFSSRCWAEGLSKAAVASLVGSGDGLAAERSHVARAIPRELMSALAQMRQDLRAGVLRAATLVAGSLLAAAGFVRGTFEFRRHPLQPAVALPLTSDPTAQMPAVTVEKAPSEYSYPIEIRQIDVDRPDQFHEVDHGTRSVWLEATRNGRVLGRKVLASVDGSLPIASVEQFIRANHDGIVPEDLDVAEVDLPRISVVIPTIARNPHALAQMVQRVVDQDYPDFDVVVVDNRTEVDIAPLPDFARGDRVRTVVEKVRGVASARNRGVAVSCSTVIAFTDDDVLVEAGWLRALGSRFAVDPELDALGGLILPAVLETPAQLWFEEYFGGFSRSYLPARASSDNHEDDEVFPFAPGRYAAGANMAFRREALERIGGFERELGTGTLTKGGEDIAAVLELAGLGSVVGYEPRAVVRHRHRVTPEDFRQQVFGYGVGLTAMYTSFALRHPRQIRAMFGLLRVGFSSLSSSRALRSPDDSPSYPKSTKAVELVGMLYGPIAYFRSWFHFRRL